MSATYLDSSAIVKLAIEEPESVILRRSLRRRRPLMSSALAHTEVLRALLLEGELGLARGRAVLARLDLDHVLNAAGSMLPADLRSLDAIHLAIARLLRPGSRSARLLRRSDAGRRRARREDGEPGLRFWTSGTPHWNPAGPVSRRRACGTSEASLRLIASAPAPDVDRRSMLDGLDRRPGDDAESSGVLRSGDGAEVVERVEITSCW